MLTMAYTQKYLKYSAALVRLLQELRRCESALRPEISDASLIFKSSTQHSHRHIDLSGSWFSSEKQLICWNVPMIRLIAANWARLSEISSSYKEKAWIIIMTLLVKENVAEL